MTPSRTAIGAPHVLQQCTSALCRPWAGKGLQYVVCVQEAGPLRKDFLVTWELLGGSFVVSMSNTIHVHVIFNVYHAGETNFGLTCAPHLNHSL